MCAQFILKIKANELTKKFGVKIPEPLFQASSESERVTEAADINLRVRGFVKTDQAPVVRADDKGRIVMSSMMYSLCPTWSSEFPYKWSSYNARMERPKSKSKPESNFKSLSSDAGNRDKGDDRDDVEYIYQVPTWRESFAKGWTCLVPMTAAVESSYFGSHAGQIVQFSTEQDSLFYCVGLWSPWIDRASGEIKETFALITDDPYEFFFRTGHDRSIFVLDDSEVEEWLLNKKWKPRERFDFLRSRRIALNWKATKERDMAKGWQKRAPSSEELVATKVWS